MAIRHQASLLCEYFIASDNDKVSYVGVVVNVAGPAFPFRLNRLFIVVEFTADDGDEYSISLHDPRGRRIGVLVEPKLVGPDTGSRPADAEIVRRVVVELGTVIFHKPGTYQIRLRDVSRNRTIHIKKFGVFATPPPESDL